MILETRAVGPFMKNGYLLGCERTRDGVLIDPGDEVDELLALAVSHGLGIRLILLTHGHLDHVTGTGRAKRATAAPIVMHRGDHFLYQAAQEQGRWFGLEVEPPPPIDRFYDEGDREAFGDFEIRVHHTPGHSPGGVCLQVDTPGAPGRALFVGDTLFAGSIGRTDLPGGDYDVLLRTIRTKLLPLGDEAVIYPGHGPASMIGQERRTNPFLK